MTRWDIEVPAGTRNATQILGDYMIVRTSQDDNTRLMLFQVMIVRRTDHQGSPDLHFYKFSAMEFPLMYLDGGVYHSDGIPTQGEQYWIERDATDARPQTIYRTTIVRTRSYITTSELGNVHVYDVHRPGVVLPPQLLHVRDPKNDHLRQWFVYSGEQWSNFPAPAYSPPASIPVKPSIQFIPVHIFHAFVEMAITKKEDCPILMEPITKENVAAPPCGHLFTKEALQRCLQESGKCPTCRQKATANEIQTW